MKNLIKKLARLLQFAARKGASDSPYRVVESVKQLLEAGGTITTEETNAIQQAIQIALGFDVYGEDERDQLNDLLSDVQAEAEGLDDEPGLEISAQLEDREDEDDEDGTRELQFSTRLIKSGISVDGHYYFTKEALRNAVSMFAGAQCFADHAEMGDTPSVKNLVGWFENPTLVDLEDGEVAVEADLHVLKSSPFAKSLRELAERGALHTVGLSISAQGEIEVKQDGAGNSVRHVMNFSEIESTDLVTRPNAGGKILELRQAVYAAVNKLPAVSKEKLGIGGGVKAAKKARKNGGDGDGDPVTDPKADEALSEVQRLRAEVERERLANQIDALISNSDLPEPALRTVENRVRGAKDIETAKQIMAQAVDLWAVAIEDNSRAGDPVGVQVTAQPTRKVLALQGMLSNESVDGVQPYRSIRQAYADVTGRNVSAMTPQQFATAVVRGAWGFSSENAHILATIDDTDWPYALGQAILREVVRQYQLPQFNEWRDLVGPSVGNLNDMRTVTRVRTGYFDLLPTVAKGGTFQPLTEPSEERISYAPTKRGGTADFTWEDALNDDLNQLRQIPGKLATSAKLTLWYYVLNEIAQATPTSMTYDSIAWFHASHSNLGSTALTIAGITAARKAIMTQSVLSASNINIGAKPKFLWIPPDLEETALKLKNSEYDPNVGDGSTSNPWKDTFEIRIIPFWSDADAWAMTADPAMVPILEVGFLGGSENPELATEAENSGSNFSADKVTYRVKQVFGVKPLDHRGVYKQVP